MSIASKINEAREYITLLLQQFEEGALPTEAYSLERIRDRKVNWHCIKSSQILHNIPEDSFPQQTISEVEDNPTHVLRLPIARAMITTDDAPILSSTISYRPPPNYIAPAVQHAHKYAPREVPQAGDRITSALPQSRSSADDRDVNDSSGNAERLLMSGFAEVQTLLRQQNPTEVSKRKCNPYVSLGELGIAEGWTTSVTNAAFCYDNNPAEGWRREVAIRMSGKSRGSIDIHYVTPDKTRRFRSKQDLQSYLSKVNASSNFINTFDFRTVFCLCHDNEDPSRSFLECSYGLAGCNKWLHPECIGLGRRSDRELELMPKVICPYCAAYLRGTGELAAYVTPDMLVLNELPASWSGATAEEDEDGIEESATPHVLWGLQGSQYVYCSMTQASGMDAFDEVFDVPAVAGSSNYKHQAYLGTPKENASSSGSAPNGNRPDSTAELASGFLQHRLFQGGWASGGAGGESSTHQASSQPAAPAEDVIPSDDDEGVPSNGAQLDPGDRVRRARHSDGTTTMVRVEGGWMPRKKPRLEEAPATTLEVPVVAAEVSGTRAIPDEIGLTPEEDADRTRRVLAKASEKGSAPFVSVSVRYKNEAIEAAVNAVQSSSHRKKATFSTSALTSIASSTVMPQTVWSTNGTSQTVTELLDAYRINPSLCYLPMEDGGIRFTSVSFAPVPRSLHPLCIANLMCGYCMTYNGDETMSQSAAAAAANAEVASRAKAKKAKKLTAFVPPELNRFALTDKAFGAVHYMVHKQCADTAVSDIMHPQKINDFVASDDIDGTTAEIVITLGAAHEYEQAEDAECDLCWRKGGVLQYFHIHPSCSSIPPPTEDGWLAHIPCLHYLHSGNLLQPLSDRARDTALANIATTSSAASSQGPFASNPFSNDVGTGAYVTAQAVTSDSVEAEEPSGSASAGSDDGEEHDDAAKERLQQQNRLYPRPPLSQFDQLFSQWRCAICGLQCGLTLRCASAGCAVRVHPLCATTLQCPEWLVCSVETEPAQERDGVPPATCMLCPIHSAGLPRK